MKEICFVTTARSDFSYILTTINFLIQNKPSFHISLLVTGTHFDKSIGNSINDVRRDAKVKLIEVNPYINGDENEITISGNILLGLERIHFNADIVVLLGDRYEILPIANYCLVKGIILAHMFGGECDTAYCLDTFIRDAITKMAHIHFVAHKDIKSRLISMGEEEKRIFVMGNPSISLLEGEIFSNEINSFLLYKDIVIDQPLVNVCYHPVTTDREVSEKELLALLKALEKCKGYIFIWSGINNDPGSNELKRMIIDFVKKHNHHYFFDNLGRKNYFSLLKNAKFMIGNSSSGLLEAATFNLPVINIGKRQSGRLCGDNVFNVEADSNIILETIKKVEKENYNYENVFFKKNGLNLMLDVFNKIEIDINLRLKKLNYSREFLTLNVM